MPRAPRSRHSRLQARRGRACRRRSESVAPHAHRREPHGTPLIRAVRSAAVRAAHAARPESRAQYRRFCDVDDDYVPAPRLSVLLNSINDILIFRSTASAGNALTFRNNSPDTIGILLDPRTPPALRRASAFLPAAMDGPAADVLTGRKRSEQLADRQNGIVVAR